MKAWITRYALTNGIKEVEGEIGTNGDLLTVKNPHSTPMNLYYHGRNKRDWCDNEDDAIRISEEMRKKKIASLQKQITKLEKLKFGGQ